MSNSVRDAAGASSPVIEAMGVQKRFGKVAAVDGLSFSVAAGSVLGILGPNGAGKTTTIKLLTTLLPIDAGRASVAGHDVATEPAAVRASIGLAGQSAAVDGKLSVRQNLDLFGRLYHLPASRRAERVRELVDRFGMQEYADRLAETLSGGERRRLDLVVALIAEPPAIFLDEPTTGLDPRGRAAIWDEIRAIRDAGAAVVLTTQYLEEADQLADHIVIIDRGKVVASGTSAELKTRLGRDVLEVTLARSAQLATARAAIDPTATVIIDERTLHATVADTGGSLSVLRRLDRAGIELEDFQLRRPTLDDVFIEITGRPSSPHVDTPAEVVA